MKRIWFFGTLAILTGLISCQKNNKNTPGNTAIYDTVKPADYFPAFPGSFWVYDNDDTLKVADQYEKYIFNAAGYTAEPDYDTLILPKLILNGIYNFNDSIARVKEYSISKASGNYRDPAFKEMLSTTEGGELIMGGAFQDHQIRGRVVKTDTTIEINGIRYDQVIITMHFDNFWSGYGISETDYAFEREYFAKNIGLIKREVKNYPMDTVFQKDIELIEYKINR